jgi:hypothetical protein
MRRLIAFRSSSCLRRTNTNPEAHRPIPRLHRTHHVVLFLLVLGSSTAFLPIAAANASSITAYCSSLNFFRFHSSDCCVRLSASSLLIQKNITNTPSYHDDCDHHDDYRVHSCPHLVLHERLNQSPYFLLRSVPRILRPFLPQTNEPCVWIVFEAAYNYFVLVEIEEPY